MDKLKKVLITFFVLMVAGLFAYSNKIYLLANEQKEQPSALLESKSKTDTTSSDTSFVVFDGTSFDEHSEELSEAGLVPIDIAYQVHLWGKPRDQIGPWELPPRPQVVEQARQARQINPEMAIIDIEHWPTKGADAKVRRSIHNYTTVYEWYKETVPDMKVGYYDTILRKNWFASTNQRLFNRWQAANDFLAPLVHKVDVLFPSLYTYKKDREYWLESTRVYLKEIRRIAEDKPVYAFLWPQYYAKDDPSLRDVYIEAEFWRLQLETARKYTDGVVIWLPYDTPWEEAVRGPWLEVTKEFLRK